MRTFAENQNQPQPKSSANLTRSNTFGPAASQRTHAFLNSQRTTGNQAVLRSLQAGANGLEAGSDTGVGTTTEIRSETPTTTHFAHDFSRIPVHAPAPITIQPKLDVNTPGDIYEQEADHIAEQVMRTPEPQLQRTCVCGGGCSKCQTEQPNQERARLQTRQVGSSEAGQTAAPTIVHEVLASPGQPLDASMRAFFEPRFGHDFSQVRVHTGAAAEQSARDVNASAYTVGNNMMFGAGQFAPGTHEGRRLIAHELTHVMQQSGSDAMSVVHSNESPGLSPVTKTQPARLLSRQPSTTAMPRTDRQILESCSGTHRDSDLKVRAEKYKEDEACIYRIVKRTMGGTLEREADRLIQWASIHQVMAGDLLQSMFSAPASPEPINRLAAGTVFAIVAEAGLSGLMTKIRDGQLKVYVLHDTEFNTSFQPSLGRQTTRTKALYLPAKDIVVLRFETISIEDPSFRGLVIHELTHATDDAERAAGTHIDTERRAHLEEARYLLEEIKDDETALDSVARDTVDNPRPYLLTAALIQTKRFKQFEPTCKKLVEKTNYFAVQKGQRPIPSFEQLIAITIPNLQRMMDKQMRDAGYKDEPANYDGLTR